MMFDFISPLSELLVQGISAWTSESRWFILLNLPSYVTSNRYALHRNLSRLKHLKAMNHFITFCGLHILPSLTVILNGLGSLIRDEDSVIRSEAGICCANIGSQLPQGEILILLMPRAHGIVEGGDTAFSSKYKLARTRRWTHIQSSWRNNRDQSPYEYYQRHEVARSRGRANWQPKQTLCWWRSWSTQSVEGGCNKCGGCELPRCVLWDGRFVSVSF
jgi:hypothetical protein